MSVYLEAINLQGEKLCLLVCMNVSVCKGEGEKPIKCIPSIKIFSKLNELLMNFILIFLLKNAYVGAHCYFLKYETIRIGCFFKKIVPKIGV